MHTPVEVLLFVFLIATAVVVARLRDLFAAAMLTGILSLLSAGLFTLMDAVDVAFTEAAVGAGISTILMLGALALTRETERPGRRQLLPVVIVVATGAVLVYGTFGMPRYGDPAAPIHHHVAPEYIEGTFEHFGIPNVVTAVLGSYRGYDTLGETTVVFTASVGVMLLLARRRSRGRGPHELEAIGTDEVEQARRRALERGPPDRADGDVLPMHKRIVLRIVGRSFVPFILLFALYVQFHGDFGPGGGFQAGVIFASGLVLYGIIFGLDELERVVPSDRVEIGLALGVLIYAGTGLLTIALGGAFLDYDHLAHDPHHGQHYGLLAIEAGVGITVACAMTTLYYRFAGRSR